MAAAVPIVEAADDADPPRVGRPDREGDARDTLDLAGMGAQMIIDAEILALPQQMEVELAEQAGETIGIIDLRDGAAIFPPQAIGEALGAAG